MTPLGEIIRDEIRRSGPIPFARFMDLALYHPQLGYYRRERDPFGKRGDYYTNSQLQPVFGRLVAQQIERWRRDMGSPPDFTAVELGPGRGETLAEVERILEGASCLGVEQESSTWPENFAGVVYSNEFFDALPVHSVRRSQGKLIEYCVAEADDSFAWAEGELSDEHLVDYVDHYCPGLAEGQRVEINLAALQHLERVAAALQRGYVLTIDYGFAWEEIRQGQRLFDGSLMGYRHHQADPKVLDQPGERDITAHVNFTALIERGQALGLSAAPLQTQMQFVLGLGEADHFARALGAASEAESLRLRMQLKTLLTGMGETFQVLVQSKGMG